MTFDHIRRHGFGNDAEERMLMPSFSNALATFGRTVRMGIDEMDDLKDADSADVDGDFSRRRQMALARESGRGW